MAYDRNVIMSMVLSTSCVILISSIRRSRRENTWKVAHAAMIHGKSSPQPVSCYQHIRYPGQSTRQMCNC